MKATEVLQAASDALTVRRVFGDPYEKDGLTVIPAALVTGGAGGGGGQDRAGMGGEGGGFGVYGRPAGALIIQDGVVSWRSAVDLNRLILTAGAVIIVYLFTRRRRRSRSARPITPATP
jgi:uncharacterized spore protein YtfJ